MSYILDALRRADSERERGSVPGIHAQPVPVPSPQDLARRGTPPWLWIVLGLVVGLLVPLGWWLLGSDAPAATPASTMAPPPIPVAPEPVAPVAPVAAAPAAPPAVALPAPIERRPTADELAAAERKAAAPAPVAAAASAPSIVARHELPEEIRRQLPPVAVSGSMFSPDPASRFLVINGQVVHEKGELGPDHVLVQIKLRAAVLRFKGQLYEITY